MKKSSKINLKQSLNTDLTVEALLAILAQKDQQLAAKSARIELLEEQLRLATLRKFAASSEKSAYQISLFDEAELEGSLDDLNQQVEALEEQPKKKSQSTRKRGFAENLPRKQVHISLTDAEILIGRAKTELAFLFLTEFE